MGALETSHQRLKVLAAAYACSPVRGSEEGVGWGWCRSIAERHDLWILTAEHYRNEIEAELDRRPELRRAMHFVYVPHKPWHYQPTPLWLRIEQSMLKPIMNQAYRSWQKDAARIGAELHLAERFDLVHQITYVGFRFPGHLWKLPIPFIWGPIGGLENTPWRFLALMDFRGAVYYAGRNLINSYHRRWLRGPKRAMRKAEGRIIAATGSISREIERFYKVKSRVVCEIGLPSHTAGEIQRREAGEPLRLCWSGQHLPGKALPLLLRALERLPATVDWRLEVLGTGPHTRRWRRIAAQSGVGDRCTWHGWIPRDAAVETMRRCHVFVVTSLKDLTSSVLLEALSQGLPVIALDHCGFSDVVTADCGIKVPVTTPEGVTLSIAEAIVALEGNEPRRRALASGALRRSQDFTWGAKLDEIDRIYRAAIHESTSQEIHSGQCAALPG